MRLYRIGEVARRAKLKPSAVRYYEDEGLIPKPLRQGGRRMFDEQVFDHLALIAVCQAAGFSLLEIRELQVQLQDGTPPGAQWRELAEKKRAELERAAARLRTMRSMLALLEQCSCPTALDCAQAARRLGAGGSRSVLPPFGG